MRKGWVETPIGDLAQVLSGFAFKSELFNKSEGIPLIRIRDLPKRDSTEALYSGSYEDRYVVKKGDFLIGMDGEFHCYEWNGPDALLNQRVCRIQDFKIGRVIPRYIYFTVNQYLDRIEQDTGYTTVKHISAKQVLGITIPLPPLPEQKRIVDLISSVDSYIEALEQQLETATRSRNAVLHELLTAGGEDWVEKTLDLVTECSWGNTETTKSKYVDSGYLAYSASGADGFLDWFEHDRTAVVLSAIGAQCGKTWFAEGKWTSIKNTIWLKADNLNLLDKYLFYLSNRDQFWQIRGQAQPFISLGDVKKTKVLLPPIVEQERIIQVISGLDSFQDSLTACLNSSKNLRAGVLSSLLSGEHEISSSYDKAMGAA